MDRPEAEDASSYDQFKMRATIPRGGVLALLHKKLDRFFCVGAISAQEGLYPCGGPSGPLRQEAMDLTGLQITLFCLSRSCARADLVPQTAQWEEGLG